MSSHLGVILEELGQTNIILSLLTKIKGLRPNSQNTCVLPFPGDLKVQIEIEKSEKNLIIGCVVGNLEPGAYRQRIFREALISNGLPPPRYGTLAFSAKTHDLILFEFLNLSDLSGYRVGEYLPSFLDKAKIWKEALKEGNIPVVAPIEAAPLNRGIFGIRP